MKLVTQLWLHKRIFLFLGNPYGSLQGSMICLILKQFKKQIMYIHREREKEGETQDFRSIIMKHKANAECIKTITLRVRVHHRYLKQRVDPKAQKPMSPCAPAFIDLSRWIKVSSLTLEPSGANELSEVFRGSKQPLP